MYKKYTYQYSPNNKIGENLIINKITRKINEYYEFVFI